MHDFFPIQSGPPFWSRSVHRTDLVKIRPISRDLPSNPLPTPPARPPRHRPCVPRLPSGGGLDGRRAQAGAGRLPCPRPPPTGQFRVCPKLSPANWPVWVCPKPTPPTGQLRVCPKMGPPTGQFGCVHNGPPGAHPPPLALARPSGRPPAPPRPQGRPTGVRGPVRARRGQNISFGQGRGRTPSRFGPILPDIYLCS